ncbi:MAG: restriction endonuclease subunit S, partial [Infirmifilum sp.]
MMPQLKIKKESEFVQTEAEAIPVGWSIKRLKDVVDYKKGTKPSILYDSPCGNCLPYLTAEYLRGEEILKYAPITDRVVIADEKDIILIWDGSNAGDVFTGFKGIVASTMVRITVKSRDVEPKFLYYQLLIRSRTLKNATKGTGIPHISRDLFDNLLISVPPLDEQRRIVEVLSVFDQAIMVVNEILERLQRVRVAMLNTLMTRGIGHREFRQT